MSKEQPGGKLLYLDCYSGVSGDMLLGSLFDLGLDFASFQVALNGLGLSSSYRLKPEKVKRGGIAGTRALVEVIEDTAKERHLSDILEIIDRSELPAVVKDNSSAVFKKLGAAEAAVHGVDVEKIHFHEVGAIDAIVDIVGVCLALELIKVDKIVCSPLPLGRGEIHSSHGKLPLPAPATVALLSDRQTPVEGREQNFEFVTPTGAALVTTLAESFGPIPAFKIEAVGYGAGSKDPGYPNFLRILYGTGPSADQRYSEKIYTIRANIDDQNPEIFSYLIDKLFAAGALDVTLAPLYMKKNRPAVELAVMAPPDRLAVLQDLIFYETTTLGIRISEAQRLVQPRRIKTIQTKWGPIQVKYVPGCAGDDVYHFAPEFEDCTAVAEKSGLPLKEIYRIAEELFKNEPGC